MKNPIKIFKAAVAAEQAERQETIRMMEDAMALDKTSAEYLKAKEIVQAFRCFRPEATVGDLLQHVESRPDFGSYNPFLAVVVLADLNEAEAAL